ncbi:hypothetical protein LguiA_025036 [Lonicera macranthoides]
MPSGAKKRKAAKKKKIIDQSTSSTLSLGGEKDLNRIDEKESDGGEGSSPASQDHSTHQHPFTEQEEDQEVEKREDPPSVQSFLSESLRGGEPRERQGCVRIEKELKSDEGFESKNVIIEWGKELHDGSSSGSSSSRSSDDESRILDKKIVVVETATPVDSVKLVEPLSEAVTQANDSVPVDVNKSVSGDSIMNSSVVVGLGLKDNGKQKLPSLDQNIRVSPVTGFMSKKEEDEVVSTSNEQATSSLDANDSVSATQVDEDRPLLSVNASKVGTSNGQEHARYSETDCSVNEPLIASAPQTVQKTSWKGCCGIFELFSGSNR